MLDHKNNFKGVLLAAAAAALFGISTPIAKLLQIEIAPIMLASLFYLGTGAGFTLLSAFSVIRKKQTTNLHLGRSDLPALLVVVIAGGIFAPLCLMLGLSHSSATTASLLLNLEGVLTALIAWLFFHENCDRQIVLGMLAITAGGAILSFNPTNVAATASSNMIFSNLAGHLLIALACLGWAIDNNFTRQIAAVDAKQIAMFKGLVAGSVNLALALLLGQALPKLEILAAALFVGFVCYGLSLVLYVVALRELGSARTSAYFATAPFLGALLALVIFHEPITLPLALAALLMSGGVYLHLNEKHEHEHEHQPIVHEHEHLHDLHHCHEHEPSDEPLRTKGGSEIAHTHKHQHAALNHSHVHYPDLHHRHLH